VTNKGDWWSVNTYVNFGLPESIRKGNATSVSNYLYSVTYGSAHTELKFSRDL